MKKLKIITALFVSVFAFSQIGINTENPQSTLTVNGSYSEGYRIVSSDTSLTIADQFVNVANASSPVTITLPNAIVTNTTTDAFFGRIYHIKNTSVSDVMIKGDTNQLLQTTAGSSSNTLILKVNQAVSIVKNSNNTLTLPLWDVFDQTTISNENNFVVGAIKTFRVEVPVTSFTTNGGSRKLMTGRAANNVGTTDRRSVYELASASDQAKFISVNGLRMDFLESTVNGDVSPKLFNTTSGVITYIISSLSTGNQYVDGANTNIATDSYSYYIDGDDRLTCTQDTIEYINAMISFSNNQEWYNCTWHATRDATNYYFYFTAERLN